MTGERDGATAAAGLNGASSGAIAAAAATSADAVAATALAAPVSDAGTGGSSSGARGSRSAVTGPDAAPTLLEVLQAGQAPAPADLRRVIALDGPAGTGKSSVARGVAARLGWRFVDTGATYRAVTLAVLQEGVDPEDPVGVADVARRARLELGTDPSAPEVLLGGHDVSGLIRGKAVTSSVSAVSAVPAVRELLIAFQRTAMGTSGAVVEGRDIATVVAPDAALKVYLDARPEVRAARRASETPAAAGPTSEVGGATAAPEDSSARHDEVAAALAARDARDRQTNPHAPSQGAVEVDTSDRSLHEVIDVVLSLARDTGALA